MDSVAIIDIDKFLHEVLTGLSGGTASKPPSKEGCPGYNTLTASGSETPVQELWGSVESRLHCQLLPGPLLPRV